MITWYSFTAVFSSLDNVNRFISFLKMWDIWFNYDPCEDPLIVKVSPTSKQERDLAIDTIRSYNGY